LKEEPLQKAISTAMKAGYQVDKETFDFIKGLPEEIDLEQLVANVVGRMESLARKSIVIDFTLVRNEAGKFAGRSKEEERARPRETSAGWSKKSHFRPYAKDVSADLKVVEDPGAEVRAEGTLKDYVGYFQDRFKRISKLLRQRLDVKDAVGISEAMRAPDNSKFKIICMIIDKRESKGGLFLTVEDLEGTATVYAPLEKRSSAVEKARSLLLDQVVCINVVRGRNKLLIADDFVLPELPNRRPNRAPIPVYAALISDLHVGSKMFMEKEFERFTCWLGGGFGDDRVKMVASHVKYVVIAGDVVDGVGIYPQQIDELSIKDVYGQYEAAAKLLENIPDHVKVIIIPGNHDASRRALPQPAIQEKYAEPLYEAREICCLGDPCVISLHGVNVLLYHGRSLDDVISLVPGMKFQEPSKAMKLLLQCRHLAPVYGQRTPIAPERRDPLVIEDAPDVFHAGHVHVMEYDAYRGSIVVNSGAWQRQTEYQKEMGHVPNPGIVPILNLHTLEIAPMDFTIRSD